MRALAASSAARSSDAPDVSVPQKPAARAGRSFLFWTLVGLIAAVIAALTIAGLLMKAVLG